MRPRMSNAPRTRIPRTDLDVAPLCLGGNVFGWTANESEATKVLDAYVAGGGNFIDTADVYSAWKPGNRGGESEAIIGRWLRARGLKNKVVVATKVGLLDGDRGMSERPILTPEAVRRGCEDSLRRLGVETIDLYYAHRPDPTTPIEATLRAFDALVREGKVRAIAASNYEPAELAEALATSDKLGLARFVALQPGYNLMDRRGYEGALAELCARESLVCFPYYALAKGFLSGKFRPGKLAETKRGGGEQYLDDRGVRVLEALDTIAAAHRVPVAAVALAWLKAQPTVAAPIAGARTLAQVHELLPMMRLQLSDAERARLSTAAG